MNTLEEYLASIPVDEVAPEPVAPPETLLDAGELVVEKRTGAIRQAGADTTGAAIVEFKREAEQSLFMFMVGVLGRRDLTVALHKPLCDGLQQVPPRRKLRLYPRHHRKTSIVSHGLPMHMTIQPSDGNLYFPGCAGTDVRVLLSGETEALMKGALRVMQTTYESNKILRGLWPHVIWDKPRAESKKWNDLELLLPRAVEYPEPTITIRGVGGAITGLHPNVLIKDDLISLEARRSDAVMDAAIQWHKASRGLIEGNASALEFMIGTRWRKFDLYSYIMDNDHGVDCEVRAMMEDGKLIYPEIFTLEDFDRLRSETEGFGPELFSLLYMNMATGAGLTDFDLTQLRSYRIAEGGILEFDIDERDIAIAERAVGTTPSRSSPSPASQLGYGEDRPHGRDEFLRYPARPIA